MAKIFKTGNSLAVTVPSHFVEALGLRPGDKVQVESWVEKGQVVYKFSGIRQLPLGEDLIFHPKRRKF